MLKSFSDEKTLIQLGFAREAEQVRKKKKKKDANDKNQNDEDDRDPNDEDDRDPNDEDDKDPNDEDDKDPNDENEEDQNDEEYEQQNPVDQQINLSFLIVDIENTYNDSIKSNMMLLGHNVAQAFDHTEALDFVKASIENSAPYHAVLIAAQMPCGETVIGGETVALQLRKIGYSGQVIVWNSDEPGCTRIDKPESVDNIGKVLEGIFPVFKNKVKPISCYIFLCLYAVTMHRY
jgi:hypothetical protein